MFNFIVSTWLTLLISFQLHFFHFYSLFLISFLIIEPIHQLLSLQKVSFFAGIPFNIRSHAFRMLLVWTSFHKSDTKQAILLHITRVLINSLYFSWWVFHFYYWEAAQVLEKLLIIKKAKGGKHDFDYC